MDRREFIKSVGVAGSMVAGMTAANGLAAGTASAGLFGRGNATASRKAMQAILDAIREVETKMLSSERGFTDPAELAEAERGSSLPLAIETVFAVLSSYRPLDELVAERVPSDADPERDVVLLVRAGALYPLYRTYALLEQLKGRVSVPTVLMYPGDRVGPKGLSFMGVADPEHNYRPWIVE